MSTRRVSKQASTSPETRRRRTMPNAQRQQIEYVDSHQKRTCSKLCSGAPWFPCFHELPGNGNANNRDMEMECVPTKTMHHMLWLTPVATMANSTADARGDYGELYGGRQGRLWRTLRPTADARGEGELSSGRLWRLRRTLRRRPVARGDYGELYGGRGDYYGQLLRRTPVATTATADARGDHGELYANATPTEFF